MFHRLLITDFKRIKKLIAPLLCTTLFFSIIIILCVIFANKILYKDNSVSIVKVGLVADTESGYMQKAYSLVSEMDSYKQTCEFVEVSSRDEGLYFLKNGEINALIIIPDDLLNSIMYGGDNPIEVVYNPDGSLETYTINEVFISTSSMLATTQAATTTIYSIAKSMGLSDEALKSLSDEADQMYFNYILSRTDIFEKEELNVTGAYTGEQFFLSTGLLIMMFFCGIVFLFFVKGNNNTYILKLKSNGINRFQIMLSQFFNIIFSLYIIYLIFYFAVLFVCTLLKTEIMIFRPAALISIIPALVFIALIVLVSGYLPAGYTGSCMILFFTTLVLAYIGGGIIPERLLPEFIGGFAENTPYHYLLETLCNGLYG